jgi:hypothetical protein
LEKLTPQVYRDLYRAAEGCVRAERLDHTLQATALINWRLARGWLLRELSQETLDGF